jgi:hypothetical protein
MTRLAYCPVRRCHVRKLRRPTPVGGMIKVELIEDVKGRRGAPICRALGFRKGSFWIETVAHITDNPK